MIHRYIPYLTWDARNIAYLILYHEYKHGLQRVKKPAKRIKNNQFNIKWYFNRILKAYYQATKLSHLTYIESRLDVILFRTNWFKTKEAVRFFIKNGLIKVNNKIIQGGDVHLLPGDVIQIRGSKQNLGSHLPGGEAYIVNSIANITQEIKQTSNPGAVYNGTALGEITPVKGSNNGPYIREPKEAGPALVEWYKNKGKKMAQNPAWLEINNNTKTIVILKQPKFSNIPYPFNLHKFYV